MCYCETKCPVIGEAAIIVEPMGELRLMSGSYQQKARELGLIFHAKTTVADDFILNSPATFERDIYNVPRKDSKTTEAFLPHGFILDE